jgi:hypothetical protein
LPPLWAEQREGDLVEEKTFHCFSQAQAGEFLSTNIVREIEMRKNHYLDQTRARNQTYMDERFA